MARWTTTESTCNSNSSISTRCGFSTAGSVGSGPRIHRGAGTQEAQKAQKKRLFMSKTSRRKFLGTTAGAAMAIGSGPATAIVSAQAPATESELTLLNGRIHTMDARNTIARAVSIKNGRFVTVGNTAPSPARGSRVIDLKG